MLKLRQVLHPHAVSVLNKVGQLKGATVPERSAYRDLMTAAEPLQKKWKALYNEFQDKLSDPQVSADLHTEWNTEIPELKKLPCSLLEKMKEESTMNEIIALEDLCEK